MMWSGWSTITDERELAPRSACPYFAGSGRTLRHTRGTSHLY